MGQHLWEVDHPYYMQEGNYCDVGQHLEYDSFDDFVSEWGEGTDIDMNRVHRFDWMPDEDAKEAGTGTLYVYFVLQRKARLMSCECPVTAEDEPRVIGFLRPHYEREKQIWAPFGA